MKRAAAIGLGALLAGSALPAAAASHIDFSAYYRLMYISETNSSYGRKPESFTDAYFQDRLNLDLSFRPTDEITVHWRLRGPGSYQRWGNQGRSRNTSLYTEFIYGEIKPGWGRVLIGRLSDDLDVYGLAALGYRPENIPVFTNVGPFDRADILDGLRFSRAWDSGFRLMAQYGKISNNNQAGGQVGNPPPGSSDTITGSSDQDWDQFRLEAAHGWDGGGASLGLFYDRNARPHLIGGSGIPYRYQIEAPIPGDPDRKLDVNHYKYEQWGLNPAVMHSWGDFSFHFEGQAQWAKARYISQNSQRDAQGRRVYGRPLRAEGFGAYLDFDYNYGPGNITVAAWWASGSGLDEYYKPGGKSRSIGDLVGGNFYPLLVAYNGDNLNPGGNRYYAGEAGQPRNSGRHVSAIGFANNAYANYVRAGHLGQTGPGLFGNISATGTPGLYAPSKGSGTYYAINDAMSVNLNSADTPGSPGIFYRDVLNADINLNRSRTTSFNENTDANHWAVALTGSQAFTDDISMHYGLAYLALNQPNYRISNGAVYSGTSFQGKSGWTNSRYSTQNKDLGFEIDLGFSFRLLDNLRFTSAFGYLWSGDAYKQFKGYKLHMATGGIRGTDNNYTGVHLPVEGDRVSGVWADGDDSYVWFNSLTFEF